MSTAVEDTKLLKQYQSGTENGLYLAHLRLNRLCSQLSSNYLEA